jgi:hypothetical protein
VGLFSGVFLGGYGVPSICGTICILFRSFSASCGDDVLIIFADSKKKIRMPLYLQNSFCTLQFGACSGFFWAVMCTMMILFFLPIWCSGAGVFVIDRN